MNTPYQPQHGPQQYGPQQYGPQQYGPQQGAQQQPPPQQPGPYGQPSEPQAAPGGPAAIELNARYSALEFMYALFTPVVTVDGYRMPAAWGRNVYTVPPGQHQVDVHIRYFGFPVGKASLAGPAWPGPPTQLEYRPPWIVYMRGALGSPPQKSPGKVASLLIALLVVAVVVIVAVTASI